LIHIYLLVVARGSQGRQPQSSPAKSKRERIDTGAALSVAGKFQESVDVSQVLSADAPHDTKTPMPVRAVTAIERDGPTW
jgi:hypothetical protein